MRQEGASGVRVEDAGELRADPLTGVEAVIAPERGRRPVPPRRDRTPGGGVPGHDPGCPFCPGNEAELPNVLAEIGGREGEPWAARAVPNRFPAFGPGDAGRATERTPGGARPGGRPARGYQEVLVETPRHDLELGAMDGVRLRTVVELYHGRYAAAARSGAWSRIFLFRNRGRAAGSSLEHPHAQLVAVERVPPVVARRDRRAEEHRARTGRCLVCDLDALEPEPEARRVLETDGFRVVVPWAATAGCQTRIVPREHPGAFERAPAPLLDELARVLGHTIRATLGVLGEIDYNLLLRGGPPGDEARHWYVELRPRVGQIAGFELASGTFLNPSSPESDARALRERVRQDRAR